MTDYSGTIWILWFLLKRPTITMTYTKSYCKIILHYTFPSNKFGFCKIFTILQYVLSWSIMILNRFSFLKKVLFFKDTISI